MCLNVAVIIMIFHFFIQQKHEKRVTNNPKDPGAWIKYAAFEIKHENFMRLVNNKYSVNEGINLCL